MSRVKAFHNSGRWDRSPDLLERNVRRMRRDGRTLGTRTEMGSAEFTDELDWPKDGWGHYHPRDAEKRLTDCTIEWDEDLWRLEDAYTVQLTKIRIHTARGFPLPFSQMPVVLLWNLEDKRHLLVGAAHMALANTELRRLAWRDEANTIRDHFAEKHREHPGWELLWQGDGNRNQRLRVNRELVRRHMLRGTGMHNLWAVRRPLTGGTHGTRSLLDLTLTTMDGKSRLLPDDGSSDHRPYESVLTL